MAVRVSRLRGAENAAADAAIAISTLLIFEKMSDALILCVGD